MNIDAKLPLKYQIQIQQEENIMTNSHLLRNGLFNI